MTALIMKTGGVLGDLTKDSNNNHHGKKKGESETVVGAWSEEEHLAFLKAMQKVPENEKTRWKLIAEMIPTRNPTQVRTHATKYFRTLARRERNAQANGGTVGKSGSTSSSVAASLSKKRPAPSSTGSPTSVAAFQAAAANKFHQQRTSQQHLSTSTQRPQKPTDVFAFDCPIDDTFGAVSAAALVADLDEAFLLSPHKKRKNGDVFGGSLGSDDKLLSLLSLDEDECLDWLLDFFEDPTDPKKSPSVPKPASPNANSPSVSLHFQAQSPEFLAAMPSMLQT